MQPMQPMQPVPPLESSGKIAFREGLYLGLILGALHLVLTLFNEFVAVGVTAVLSLIVLIIVWLGAFFLAGFRASKRTALVSTGTLAGLWSGVIGGLIGFVVNVVLVAARADASREAAQALIDRSYPNIDFQYTNGSIIAIGALLNICLWVAGIGVAAGIGALAGLAGRSRSPMKPYLHFYQRPPYPSPSHPEGVPYPPRFEQGPPPYPPTPTPPPSE